MKIRFREDAPEDVHFISVNSVFQVMLSVHFQHTQGEPCIRMRTGCRRGRIMAIMRAVIATFSCFLLLYSNEGKLRPQDDAHYFRSHHIPNILLAQRHKTNNAMNATVSYLRMRVTKHIKHHEEINSTLLCLIIQFGIFKNDCVGLPVVLYVCGI